MVLSTRKKKKYPLTRKKGTNTRRKSLCGGSIKEIQSKINAIYGTDFDLPTIPYFSITKKSKSIRKIRNKTRKLIKLDKKIKRCEELIKGRSKLEQDVMKAVTAYHNNEVITERIQNKKINTKGFIPDDDYVTPETEEFTDDTPDKQSSMKRKSISLDLSKNHSLEKRMANRYNSNSKSKSKSKSVFPDVPPL